MGVDLTKIVEVIASVKEDLSNAELVEEKVPEIEAVVKDVQEIFEDGFQWADVGAILGQVVPGLMDIAKTVEGKTGAEKKEFVVDCVWTLYKVFDPDIPYVPEFIENKLEKLVVHKATEMAVEAVCSYAKKKGIW